MSNREWMLNLAEAAVVTIVVAAVCQELEKPKEERHWHGKLGIIPYDFRIPTLERLKEAYWNPYESRIFSPEVFGIGWAINFCALLEKLRAIAQEDVSEESFLMPTKSIREVLADVERIEV